jgi:hypothetical protein
MNPNPYARMTAVAVGAATIYGLQQGLELSFWIALPLAIVAYAATVISVGYFLAARTK